MVDGGLAGTWLDQRLHDALEAIDARTLYEHRDAGVQVGLDVAYQHLGIGEPLGTGAETLDRSRREAPEREQPLDPACTRIAADLRVACFAVRAEFAHIAEYQPFDARERAQHVEARANRVRIRVVGIVDDPALVSPGLELQAARHRAKAPESRGDLPDRGSGSTCGGCRAQRVDQVVDTAGMQRDRGLSQRALQGEARDEFAALDLSGGAARGEVR